MPPSYDSREVKIVFIKVAGGESPAAGLAPKIGPLGLSPAKVADEISRATAEWKGHKVTVKLTIQNLQAKIDVIPTPTTWILKELRLPPTADRMKAVNGVKHIGNLSFDQILLIARQMRPRSGAKKLEGTVKEILGSCGSLGVTIDGLQAQEYIKKIRNGELKVPNDCE